MRVIPVLAAVAVITYSDITDQEPAMKSNASDPQLGTSIFKDNSERDFGQSLSQSDIVLPKRQAEQIDKNDISGNRVKRLVLKDLPHRNVTWKDGVFYTFNTTDQTIQRAFKMGVKIWRDNTCINFYEDKNAMDKVVVLKSNRCTSAVGRRGGEQYLCLSENGAMGGSAVHEIGHALGLLHTMQRYDRDSFITVVTENLDPLFMNNFKKVIPTFTDVYNLTYDYGSIMHYGELSGSTNKKPTIISTDSHYQKTMGSPMISFHDIYIVNKRYGCDGKCNKSTSANCMNEGFPHPRNCSICICPSGYGGALCDRRPPGCGEDLVAMDKMKTLTYRLGFGSGLRDQFNFCHYLISAPEKKKIEVDVQSISLGFDGPGCKRGGVEIKAQEDQKMTGYRFCSINGSGGPIVSTSNLLPVILYNKHGSMQTIFKYRYID